MVSCGTRNEQRNEFSLARSRGDGVVYCLAVFSPILAANTRQLFPPVLDSFRRGCDHAPAAGTNECLGRTRAAFLFGQACHFWSDYHCHRPEEPAQTTHLTIRALITFPPRALAIPNFHLNGANRQDSRCSPRAEEDSYWLVLIVNPSCCAGGGASSL